MMLSQVKAITLLEILAVIIIIGVLATLGLPRFGPMRERALDKEAKANLKLIQAAEKIYRMEISVFWPNDGTTVGVEEPLDRGLNTNLKLDLSDSDWTYQASSNLGSSPLDARATRNNPPTGWARTYSIDEDGARACCSSSETPNPCDTQDLPPGCP